MSPEVSTLIEQVEQLLGDTPEAPQLALPGQWDTPLSRFESDYRLIVQGVHNLEERVRALESGRRQILERIVESIKAMA